MIRNDLSHWPLVISVASGPTSLEELTSFTEDWGRWLTHGERFATLRIFADTESLVHPEGSAKKGKQWLQEQGEAIRQQVSGMATVVPASEYERMRKMNVEKLYGVPAATFADVPSALAWLDERVFTPQDIRFEQATIAAAVDAALDRPTPE